MNWLELSASSESHASYVARTVPGAYARKTRMSAPLETQFARIERLPPYVFSITSELKMAARRRGEDIIDFGIGNPDGPTPAHIVAKLVRHRL